MEKHSEKQTFLKCQEIFRDNYKYEKKKGSCGRAPFC